MTRSQSAITAAVSWKSASSSPRCVRRRRAPRDRLSRHVALDADDADAGRRQQRLQPRKRDRAVAIVDVVRIAGPGERDALARQRVEPRPPRGDALLARAQIRNARRHVRERGLERERQAAERTMHVERRQRFAARENAHAFETGQQVLQLGLHLEHHRRAALRQQRRIAGELDRVAQTLLGMQQDGLASRADIRRARAACRGCAARCRRASSATRIRQSRARSRRPSAAPAPR